MLPTFPMISPHFYAFKGLPSRSEGRSSRGISSPGGGADQDQVFPCHVVVVVVGLQKTQNVNFPENIHPGLDAEDQMSKLQKCQGKLATKTRQKSIISRMIPNDLE